ncbi:hypothetical protein JXM83_02145 [Candidatus Woesearchaeota archaeon]|nr:hypothetical protein [Candidatus Woesearchaeota archaeon]
MKRLLILLLLLFIPFAHGLTLYEPLVSNYSVTVNGIDSNVSFIEFDWGDTIVSKGFFPMTHNYSSRGEYKITVTSFRENATMAVAYKKIIIGSVPAVEVPTFKFSILWKIITFFVLLILAFKFGFIKYDIMIASRMLDLRLVKQPIIDFKVYWYVLKNKQEFADLNWGKFIFARSSIYFFIICIFLIIVGFLISQLFTILNLVR